MVKEKVSANQFFVLLFLSMLSTVFMYLSSPHIKIAQTDAVLRPLVFVFVSFLVCIPVFFIIKKHSGLKAEHKHIPQTKLLKLLSANLLLKKLKIPQTRSFLTKQ